MTRYVFLPLKIEQSFEDAFFRSASHIQHKFLEKSEMAQVKKNCLYLIGWVEKNIV